MFKNFFKKIYEKSNYSLWKGELFIRFKRSNRHNYTPESIRDREWQLNFYDDVLFIGTGDNKYDIIEMKKLPDSFRNSLKNGISFIFEQK